MWVNYFTVLTVKYLIDHVETKTSGGVRGTAGWVMQERVHDDTKGSCEQERGEEEQLHSQTKCHLLVGPGLGEGWRRSEQSLFCAWSCSIPQITAVLPCSEHGRWLMSS